MAAFESDLGQSTRATRDIRDREITWQIAESAPERALFQPIECRSNNTRKPVLIVALGHFGTLVVLARIPRVAHVVLHSISVSCSPSPTPSPDALMISPSSRT